MPRPAAHAGPAFNTTAPAPPPNSTPVPRSCQSRMREKVSAPITSAVLAWPSRRALSATASAKMKPEHTACTSKAAPRFIPSCACTLLAVAGKVWSGVAVASTITSRSLPLIPACSSARRAAPKARSDVSSPSAAIRRSEMPVRCRIHSSEVSSRSASSLLVTIRSGRYPPQPTIWERNIMPGPSPRAVTAPPSAAAVGLRHLIETREFVPDLLHEPVHLEVDRDADRIGKTKRIGRAVALHRNSGQAEEHRAVITARVDARRQFLQGAAREQVTYPSEHRVTEGGAQRFGEQLGHPFDGLQRDVAGEPIRDDHINGPRGNLVTLDKPVKIDRRVATAQP